MDKKLYYKCNDCTATVCIESDRQDNAVCGICGGLMRCMGEVKGNRWATAIEVADTCDEPACLTAHGPNCDCKCGGKFHGGGFHYHTELVEQGKIKITLEADHAKYIAIAQEYRRERESAMARIVALAGDNWHKYHRREYIPSRADWFVCKNLREQFNKATAAKIHSLRIKKLQAIAQ